MSNTDTSTDTSTNTSPAHPIDAPLQIVRFALAELLPWPGNARTHGERNLATIEHSLRTFGQVEPLVIQASTMRVIGGNGRREVMLALGWREANCVLLDLDDTQASALSLVLNRSGEQAGWSFHELGDQLRALQAADYDLEGLGWNDYKPSHLPWSSANQLAYLVECALPPREPGAPAPFVVLTGGEPALYDLAPLLRALQKYNLRVHIETAGHRLLPPSGLDWVTVSPKYFAHPPLDESMARADEIKLIVSSREQMTQDVVRIALGLERQGFEPGQWPQLWLHPEWSQRENPQVLDAITNFVTRCPAWRAGWQMHKNYRADLLDPNADKRLVPLGGVERGEEAQ